VPTDVKLLDQNGIFNKGTIMELAEKLRTTGVLADFETTIFKDSIESFEEEELYNEFGKSEDLLLLLHQKYGHVPMVRLQRMASLGMLPHKIQKCPVPICQACIYGKMMRRAWRAKPSKKKIESKVATNPGSIVSVNQ
jgi:hypothetical protein